jgi:hypothetical protein
MKIRLDLRSRVLAGLPALGTITNVWQAGQLTANETVQVSPLFLHLQGAQSTAVY